MTRRLMVLAVVMGLAAFVLAWSLWHLWIDHQNFHAVLNWANQQAAQAAKP